LASAIWQPHRRSAACKVLLVEQKPAFAACPFRRHHLHMDVRFEGRHTVSGHDDLLLPDWQRKIAIGRKSHDARQCLPIIVELPRSLAAMHDPDMLLGKENPNDAESHPARP
jgi:hypothetical protein